MAILQSAKTGGDTTIEASSPGLTSASFTIPTKEVTLKPQIAIWEREVPVGPGITGLWRPAAAVGFISGGGGRGAIQIFTFRQSGTMLTGVVEGGTGGRKGVESPIMIEDGKVNGAKITFKVGTIHYTGTIKGYQIELQRLGGRGGLVAPILSSGAGPVIGPPPDGSDPSTIAFYYGQGIGEGQNVSSPSPLVLVRAKR
jgi:beta-galactosidase